MAGSGLDHLESLVRGDDGVKGRRPPLGAAFQPALDESNSPKKQHPSDQHREVIRVSNGVIPETG
jgi:hypothetical protein